MATEELGVRACCSHLRAVSWDQWPGLPVSVTLRRATRRSPTLYLRASSGIGKQSRLRPRPRIQLPGAAEKSYSPLWTIHGARRTAQRVLNAAALAGPCPADTQPRPRTA